MAPLTNHLVVLAETASSEIFITSVRGLEASEKPLWVGRCHHWIHDPHLSVDALTGTGTTMKKWDYLLITKAKTLPSALQTFIADTWSLTAENPDAIVDALPTSEKTLATTVGAGPALLPGWSRNDYSAMDAHKAPTDVNLSLDSKSPVLGKDKKTSPIDIRTFTRTFGTSIEGEGPVAMFNILSFFPGKMGEYMKYVEAFTKVLGVSTGAHPITVGMEILDWSSKAEDKKVDEGVWEMTALVWYPSIWHFGQMLGDEKYAEVDRAYKIGVVRDNPLICCTPVDLS